MSTPSHRADATAHFPADGSSVGAARRLVAASLAAWGLDALEEVACLLVSELTSNVVLHAGTEFGVVLRRSGGRIRVEVHDGSPLLPERKHYSTTATTGRGLVFVAELSEAWGVDPTTSGKVVWFELDEEETPSAPAPAAAAEFNLDERKDWDDLGPAGAADNPALGTTPSGGPSGSARAARHPVGVQ